MHSLSCVSSQQRSRGRNEAVATRNLVPQTGTGCRQCRILQLHEVLRAPQDAAPVAAAQKGDRMHWKQFLRWLNEGCQEPRPYDDADWYEVRTGTDTLRHLIASPVGIQDPTGYEQATLWHIYQERYWMARLGELPPCRIQHMVWNRQLAWLGHN